MRVITSVDFTPQGLLRSTHRLNCERAQQRNRTGKFLGIDEGGAELA
jgi:hypothetical protein